MCVCVCACVCVHLGVCVCACMCVCVCVSPEEEKYQLKDEAGEREVGCNLQESLQRAKTSPIFQVSHL